MEVIRDKETGAVTIYLSKEEAQKIINETDHSTTEVLKNLNNKLWNGGTI